MATTASSAYAERASEVGAMLGWITDELASHAERARAEPKNWGLVGDLGEVKIKLRETLAFISGMTEQEINKALVDMETKP